MGNDPIKYPSQCDLSALRDNTNLRKIFDILELPIY